MKKTLTVNLGGSVFHIDEDAYRLLEKYLSNLRIHFDREDGGDETLSDIEARISEIFNEKIRAGYNVISISDVENIISRMGEVEDLFENDVRGNREKTRETPPSSNSHERGHDQRRFFRNPDDKMLGGVCGGLAAFMGWDPTAVRLLTFILMWFGGVVVFIYLILWLIVPMAQTAAERLQMRGESVTVENIGRTVTDSFENITSQFKEYAHSDRPRTALQKIADGFVSILGALMKVCAAIACIIFVPLLLAMLLGLIGAIIGLIFGGIGGLISLLAWMAPDVNWIVLNAISPAEMWICGAAVIILFAIPLLSLVYELLRLVFKYKPVSTELKWVLIILWFLSLFTSIIYVASHGWIYKMIEATI
jgi:phage shock protein PspC (stress-responsive transcriptional regulator)